MYVVGLSQDVILCLAMFMQMYIVPLELEGTKLPLYKVAV